MKDKEEDKDSDKNNDDVVSDGDATINDIKDRREAIELKHLSIQKFGYKIEDKSYKGIGWLMAINSNEVISDDNRILSNLELNFIANNGSKFMIFFPYRPYFYIDVKPTNQMEVINFFQKKYQNFSINIDAVDKTDLDLPNHLLGLKKSYLRVSVDNVPQLVKLRGDIMRRLKRNNDKNKKTFKTNLQNNPNLKNFDLFEYIEDIREYDVPYYIRSAIDNKIFVGKWYSILVKSGQQPILEVQHDILKNPELIIMAFDIETSKPLLKFPDPKRDPIIIISYVINGQGYLLINREIISEDIEMFDYTPKKDYSTNVIVFNEKDEHSLLKKWFEHIKTIKPHIYTSYNGDYFDWMYIEARAALYNIKMFTEIGVYATKNGEYISSITHHMDCLYWVKRDSYLPAGSHGLKAVTKCKLRYDPVEVDPEDIVSLAAEKPRSLANYAISDSVATYYLYMQYVHPYIFALCTIIPMKPDEVLRKGSGTLCEALLMTKAYEANIIYPNRQSDTTHKFTKHGHLLESETYVGGHVEAIEAGIFRADLNYRFKLNPDTISKLQNEIEEAIKYSLKAEHGKSTNEFSNLSEAVKQIYDKLEHLKQNLFRNEKPCIYHLDVAAMYPNIMLTNKLQPPSLIDESVCASCDFNTRDKKCQRKMEWVWRGDYYPVSLTEYQQIRQQLEVELIPSTASKDTNLPFSLLPLQDQNLLIKKRIMQYSHKVYGKRHVVEEESRKSIVCQCENSFFIDTVREFRDRRYEFKEKLKVWKKKVQEVIQTGDFEAIKEANDMTVLYDSLQMAHKCVLNSFYGYAMRRGSRWFSMEMAGIVCNTGANIITEARKIIDGIGRPLELDTDGVWCMLPSSFPINVTLVRPDSSKFTLSYPGLMLNYMIYKNFTNDQFHELENTSNIKYKTKSENSIFFEVDGPYLAMTLPASKEENKKLKKRYAVYNFDGSIAELKGFEIKRRGELQLIKIFQSSFFDAILLGDTLESCYSEMGKVANFWLDLLHTKAKHMSDDEFLNLISEHKMLSKPVSEYGFQKSTSLTTARRLAEFLGEDFIKDKGLSCKYIISHKPFGNPVTERAIPTAIFKMPQTQQIRLVRLWLKDPSINFIDIRSILDWEYYTLRLNSAIQKLITIPAIMQNISNPVPRCPYPDWLRKRIVSRIDDSLQPKITDHFKGKKIPLIPSKPTTENKINNSTSSHISSNKENLDYNKKWKDVLGNTPEFPSNSTEISNWLLFHKRKWDFLETQLLAKGQDAYDKIYLPENILANKISKRNEITLDSYTRNNKDILLNNLWDILKVDESSYPGVFNLWVHCAGKTYNIKIEVPKIFYVNSKIVKEKIGKNCRKVIKQLPRCKPVYNLYEYTLDEKSYYKNLLKTSALVTSSLIDGVYETQLPLLFRLLISLGVRCRVKKESISKISNPEQISQQFCLNDLEEVPFSSEQQDSYFYALAENRIYLSYFTCQLSQIICIYISKSQTLAFFIIAAPSKVFGVNFKDIINKEHKRILKEYPDLVQIDKITIRVELDTASTSIYKEIAALFKSQREKSFNTPILFVQANQPVEEIKRKFATLDSFIVIGLKPCNGYDECSKEPDWQINNSKYILLSCLNHTTLYKEMFKISSFLHVPIGNIRNSDTQLTGWDIAFSRKLTFQHHVLWCSQSESPDFGTSSSNFINYKDLSDTLHYDNAGFYPSMSFELRMDGLAINSILRHQLITAPDDNEVSSTPFDSIKTVSLTDMLTGQKPVDQMLITLNDTASCWPAFLILRQLVSEYMKLVNEHQNVTADNHLIHFYRWLCSPKSLLYDPGMCRLIRDLMNKLLEKLLNSLTKLGCTIIHADFHKIVVNVNKLNAEHGWDNIKNVITYLLSQDIFMFITIIPIAAYRSLLWVDQYNYGGIKQNIPTEFQSGFFNVGSLQVMASQNEEPIEMSWSIFKLLRNDTQCQHIFKILIGNYIYKLDQFVKKENQPSISQDHLNIISPAMKEKLISYKSHLLSDEINYELYNIVHGLKQTFAHRILSKNENVNTQAIQLVRVFSEVLKKDEDIATIVEQTKYNAFKILGVTDFFQLEYEQPPALLILSQIFCLSCNNCRDLDLFRDSSITINENGLWSIQCSYCNHPYPVELIEAYLIRLLEYEIHCHLQQDLKCSKCHFIKSSYLSSNCQCGGKYQITTNKNLNNLISSIKEVSAFYNLRILQNITNSLDV